MAKIYVIHENGVWVEPLRTAFAERGLPFEEWNLVEGEVDLDAAPPSGVFYNRISASSHTRNHRYSPEMASIVLNWLEGHGRRVVNNSRALQLEINKSAQYAALNSHGITTPRTIAAVGRDEVVRAASAFAPGPVIVKPNRGGKGEGVSLFETIDELEVHMERGEGPAPVDGITLLQQYIHAPARFITRAEFIGGRFYYAVRVDTSDGFELCPADVCQSPNLDGAAAKFQIFENGAGIESDQIAKYEAVLAANGIEVAGIEFITDGNGRSYTYDINTNTNYNADAEVAADKSGMGQLAEFLGCELAAVRASNLEQSGPGLRLAG